MAKVTSTINLSGLVGRLNSGAERGLQHAAEFLLTEANKTVPHDEGTLERSGSASSEGLTAAVSYDTPYAVRQHEDMTLHHDGKGQAKWLENTLHANSAKAAQIVRTAVSSEVH